MDEELLATTVLFHSAIISAESAQEWKL